MINFSVGGLVTLEFIKVGYGDEFCWKHFFD